MSFYTDVRDALANLVLMQERVRRVGDQVEKHAAAIETLDRRLVRVETMIEIAQRRRLE